MGRLNRNNGRGVDRLQSGRGRELSFRSGDRLPSIDGRRQGPSRSEINTDLTSQHAALRLDQFAVRDCDSSRIENGNDHRMCGVEAIDRVAATIDHFSQWWRSLK